MAGQWAASRYSGLGWQVVEDGAVTVIRTPSLDRLSVAYDGGVDTEPDFTLNDVPPGAERAATILECSPPEGRDSTTP